MKTERRRREMMIGKTYSGESRKIRSWIIYWEVTIDFIAFYML